MSKDTCEETKKLIIVTNNDTNDFGKYLMQLISENKKTEENIPKVEAMHWSEKEYIAKKSNITSAENVLFIGDSKIIQEACTYMDVKFDKYNMSYGWFGNIGWLKVDNLSRYTGKFARIKEHMKWSGLIDGEALTPAYCYSFLNLAKEYNKEIDNQYIKTIAKKCSSPKQTFILGEGTTFVEQNWWMFTPYKVEKKIINELVKQQYELLIWIFCKDGLYEFLK